MERWARHWATFPTRFPTTDHLRQVGKTVGGEPVSTATVHCIVDSVAAGLQLAPSDRLLDLCCGNGLLTHRLARRCREVVAVDYSAPLLAVARRDHAAENIHYFHRSALELDDLPGGTFTKVLMYEALQHFVPGELPTLIRALTPHVEAGSRLLLGSVPDRARRRHFYNTPRRRLSAFVRGLIGQDAAGTWWERAALCRALGEAGLEVRVVPQPDNLHTAHYRFDVVAEARGSDADRETR